MAKKQLKKEEDKYAGLNNSEIIFMYYRLKNYMTVLDKNLDKNVVTKQVETPLGIATAMKEVKTEDVLKFKETTYYKTACDIIEKLTPVVCIIEECDDTVISLLNEFK
jgi:hypothetical protein